MAIHTENYLQEQLNAARKHAENVSDGIISFYPYIAAEVALGEHGKLHDALHNNTNYALTTEVMNGVAEKRVPVVVQWREKKTPKAVPHADNVKEYKTTKPQTATSIPQSLEEMLAGLMTVKAESDVVRQNQVPVERIPQQASVEEQVNYALSNLVVAPNGQLINTSIDGDVRQQYSVWQETVEGIKSIGMVVRDPNGQLGIAYIPRAAMIYMREVQIHPQPVQDEIEQATNDPVINKPLQQAYNSLNSTQVQTADLIRWVDDYTSKKKSGVKKGGSLEELHISEKLIDAQEVKVDSSTNSTFEFILAEVQELKGLVGARGKDSQSTESQNHSMSVDTVDARTDHKTISNQLHTDQQAQEAQEAKIRVQQKQHQELNDRLYSQFSTAIDQISARIEHTAQAGQQFADEVSLRSSQIVVEVTRISQTLEQDREMTRAELLDSIATLKNLQEEVESLQDAIEREVKETHAYAKARIKEAKEYIPRDLLPEFEQKAYKLFDEFAREAQTHITHMYSCLKYARNAKQDAVGYIDQGLKSLRKQITTIQKLQQEEHRKLERIDQLDSQLNSLIAKVEEYTNRLMDHQRDIDSLTSDLNHANAQVTVPQYAAQLNARLSKVVSDVNSTQDQLNALMGQTQHVFDKLVQQQGEFTSFAIEHGARLTTMRNSATRIVNNAQELVHQHQRAVELTRNAIERVKISVGPERMQQYKDQIDQLEQASNSMRAYLSSFQQSVGHMLTDKERVLAGLVGVAAAGVVMIGPTIDNRVQIGTQHASIENPEFDTQITQIQDAYLEIESLARQQQVLVVQKSIIESSMESNEAQESLSKRVFDGGLGLMMLASGAGASLVLASFVKEQATTHDRKQIAQKAHQIADIVRKITPDSKHSVIKDIIPLITIGNEYGLAQEVAQLKAAQVDLINTITSGDKQGIQDSFEIFRTTASKLTKLILAQVKASQEPLQRNQLAQCIKDTILPTVIGIGIAISGAGNALLSQTAVEAYIVGGELTSVNNQLGQLEERLGRLKQVTELLETELGSRSDIKVSDFIPLKEGDGTAITPRRLLEDHLRRMREDKKLINKRIPAIEREFKNALKSRLQALPDIDFWDAILEQTAESSIYLSIYALLALGTKVASVAMKSSYEEGEYKIIGDKLRDESDPDYARVFCHDMLIPGSSTQELASRLLPRVNVDQITSQFNHMISDLSMPTSSTGILNFAVQAHVLIKKTIQRSMNQGPQYILSERLQASIKDAIINKITSDLLVRLEAVYESIPSDIDTQHVEKLSQEVAPLVIWTMASSSDEAMARLRLFAMYVPNEVRAELSGQIQQQLAELAMQQRYAELNFNWNTMITQYHTSEHRRILAHNSGGAIDAAQFAQEMWGRYVDNLGDGLVPIPHGILNPDGSVTLTNPQGVRMGPDAPSSSSTSPETAAKKANTNDTGGAYNGADNSGGSGDGNGNKPPENRGAGAMDEEPDESENFKISDTSPDGLEEAFTVLDSVITSELIQLMNSTVNIISKPKHIELFGKGEHADSLSKSLVSLRSYIGIIGRVNGDLRKQTIPIDPLLVKLVPLIEQLQNIEDYFLDNRLDYNKKSQLLEKLPYIQKLKRIATRIVGELSSDEAAKIFAENQAIAAQNRAKAEKAKQKELPKPAKTPKTNHGELPSKAISPEEAARLERYKAGLTYDQLVQELNEDVSKIAQLVHIVTNKAYLRTKDSLESRTLFDDANLRINEFRDFKLRIMEQVAIVVATRNSLELTIPDGIGEDQKEAIKARNSQINSMNQTKHQEAIIELTNLVNQLGARLEWVYEEANERNVVVAIPQIVEKLTDRDFNGFSLSNSDNQEVRDLKRMVEALHGLMYQQSKVNQATARPFENSLRPRNVSNLPGTNYSTFEKQLKELNCQDIFYTLDRYIGDAMKMDLDEFEKVLDADSINRIQDALENLGLGLMNMRQYKVAPKKALTLLNQMRVAIKIRIKDLEAILIEGNASADALNEAFELPEFDYYGDLVSDAVSDIVRVEEPETETPVSESPIVPAQHQEGVIYSPQKLALRSLTARIASIDQSSSQPHRIITSELGGYQTIVRSEAMELPHTLKRRLRTIEQLQPKLNTANTQVIEAAFPQEDEREEVMEMSHLVIEIERMVGSAEYYLGAGNQLDNLKSRYLALKQKIYQNVSQDQIQQFLRQYQLHLIEEAQSDGEVTVETQREITKNVFEMQQALTRYGADKIPLFVFEDLDHSVIAEIQTFHRSIQEIYSQESIPLPTYDEETTLASQKLVVDALALQSLGLKEALENYLNLYEDSDTHLLENADILAESISLQDSLTSEFGLAAKELISIRNAYQPARIESEDFEGMTYDQILIFGHLAAQSCFATESIVLNHAVNSARPHMSTWLDFADHYVYSSNERGIVWDVKQYRKLLQEIDPTNIMNVEDILKMMAESGGGGRSYIGANAASESDFGKIRDTNEKAWIYATDELRDIGQFSRNLSFILNTTSAEDISQYPPYVRTLIFELIFQMGTNRHSASQRGKETENQTEYSRFQNNTARITQINQLLKVATISYDEAAKLREEQALLERDHDEFSAGYEDLITQYMIPGMAKGKFVFNIPKLIQDITSGPSQLKMDNLYALDDYLRDLGIKSDHESAGYYKFPSIFDPHMFEDLTDEHHISPRGVYVQLNPDNSVTFRPAVPVSSRTESKESEGHTGSKRTETEPATHVIRIPGQVRGEDRLKSLRQKVQFANNDTAGSLERKTRNGSSQTDGGTKKYIDSISHKPWRGREAVVRSEVKFQLADAVIHTLSVEGRIFTIPEADERSVEFGLSSLHLIETIISNALAVNPNNIQFTLIQSDLAEILSFIEDPDSYDVDLLDELENIYNRIRSLKNGYIFGLVMILAEPEMYDQEVISSIQELLTYYVQIHNKMNKQPNATYNGLKHYFGDSYEHLPTEVSSILRSKAACELDKGYEHQISQIAREAINAAVLLDPNQTSKTAFPWKPSITKDIEKAKNRQTPLDEPVDVEDASTDYDGERFETEPFVEQEEGVKSGNSETEEEISAENIERFNKLELREFVTEMYPSLRALVLNTESNPYTKNLNYLSDILNEIDVINQGMGQNDAIQITEIVARMIYLSHAIKIIPEGYDEVYTFIYKFTSLPKESKLGFAFDFIETRKSVADLREIISVSSAQENEQFTIFLNKIITRNEMLLSIIKSDSQNQKSFFALPHYINVASTYQHDTSFVEDLKHIAKKLSIRVDGDSAFDNDKFVNFASDHHNKEKFWRAVHYLILTKPEYRAMFIESFGCSEEVLTQAAAVFADSAQYVPVSTIEDPSGITQPDLNNGNIYEFPADRTIEILDTISSVDSAGVITEIATVLELGIFSYNSQQRLLFNQESNIAKQFDLASVASVLRPLKDRYSWFERITTIDRSLSKIQTRQLQNIQLPVEVKAQLEADVHEGNFDNTLTSRLTEEGNNADDIELYRAIYANEYNWWLMMRMYKLRDRLSFRDNSLSDNWDTMCHNDSNTISYLERWHNNNELIPMLQARVQHDKLTINNSNARERFIVKIGNRTLTPIAEGEINVLIADPQHIIYNIDTFIQHIRSRYSEFFGDNGAGKNVSNGELSLLIRSFVKSQLSIDEFINNSFDFNTTPDLNQLFKKHKFVGVDLFLTTLLDEFHNSVHSSLGVWLEANQDANSETVTNDELAELMYQKYPRLDEWLDGLVDGIYYNISKFELGTDAARVMTWAQNVRRDYEKNRNNRVWKMEAFAVAFRLTHIMDGISNREQIIAFNNQLGSNYEPRLTIPELLETDLDFSEMIETAIDQSKILVPVINHNITSLIHDGEFANQGLGNVLDVLERFAKKGAFMKVGELITSKRKAVEITLIQQFPTLTHEALKKLANNRQINAPELKLLNALNAQTLFSSEFETGLKMLYPTVDWQFNTVRPIIENIVRTLLPTEPESTNLNVPPINESELLNSRRQTIEEARGLSDEDRQKRIESAIQKFGKNRITQFVTGMITQLDAAVVQARLPAIGKPQSDFTDYIGFDGGDKEVYQALLPLLVDRTPLDEIIQRISSTSKLTLESEGAALRQFYSYQSPVEIMAHVHSNHGYLYQTYAQLIKTHIRVSATDMVLNLSRIQDVMGRPVINNYESMSNDALSDLLYKKYPKLDEWVDDLIEGLFINISSFNLGDASHGVIEWAKQIRNDYEQNKDNKNWKTHSFAVLLRLTPLLDNVSNNDQIKAFREQFGSVHLPRSIISNILETEVDFTEMIQKAIDQSKILVPVINHNITSLIHDGEFANQYFDRVFDVLVRFGKLDSSSKIIERLDNKRQADGFILRQQFPSLTQEKLNELINQGKTDAPEFELFYALNAQILFSPEFEDELELLFPKVDWRFEVVRPIIREIVRGLANITEHEEKEIVENLRDLPDSLKTGKALLEGEFDSEKSKEFVEWLYTICSYEVQQRIRGQIEESVNQLPPEFDTNTKLAFPRCVFDEKGASISLGNNMTYGIYNKSSLTQLAKQKTMPVANGNIFGVINVANNLSLIEQSNWIGLYLFEHNSKISVGHEDYYLVDVNKFYNQNDASIIAASMIRHSLITQKTRPQPIYVGAAQVLKYDEKFILRLERRSFASLLKCLAQFVEPE